MKRMIFMLGILAGIGIQAQSYVQEVLHSAVNSDKFLIMAHKMAPLPNFAENSVKTLKYNMKHNPNVIQEIDVRLTADAIPILIHDETIDRTTTGKGKVAEYQYKDLKKVSLKNLNNEVIKDKIPTLKKALKIMKKNNALVMLDMKPNTNPDIMMEVVKATKMEENVVVICYTLEEGVDFHKKYPNIMIALGFDIKENIDKIYNSGIPTTHLVALTPQGIHQPEFYRYILDKNIPISISAQGKIDNSENPIEGYRETVRLGGTIITTDRVEAVKSITRQ